MKNLLESPALQNVRTMLGGSPAVWQVDEIGDGNVNLIYRVRGPHGQLLVKQAVPYLRCVGESWPLSTRRSFFEVTAFREHAKFAPNYLPQIYFYDETAAALVMEFLAGKLILRKGLIQKIKYPHFAEHMAEYMARTLFFTSDLALSAADKKAKVQTFCGNTDLCKITEDLIFTDPYRVAGQNRWTCPELDELASSLRADVPLQVAVCELKRKFLTATEALIHGDLHTGSIMADAHATTVIDPEFAFYGPMAFDPGLMLGNLFLNYFSQADLDYEKWILQQSEFLWTSFARQFEALWETDLRGDGAKLITSVSLLQAFRAEYMKRLWAETLGFAGAEMIRRVFGLAHVEDLEGIVDPDQRATSENRAVAMARCLIVNQREFRTIADVTSLARSLRHLQLAGGAKALDSYEAGI